MARLIELVTPIRLLVGMGAASIVVLLVGTCSLYNTDGPLPPPRDPPPKVEDSTVQSYRYKEGFYKALIKEDAQKYGVGAASYEEMKQGRRHFSEFSGSQPLKVNAKLETRHLVLQMLEQKVAVGEAGQSYRSAHLVLSITNRTDQPLAYRVITLAPRGCQSKGALPHNAVAIPAKGQVLRSECLAHGGTIRILQVEVLELSPLGYYYASRLDPQQLKYDLRTTEGHEIPGGLPPCRLLPWRVISREIGRNEISWYDVVDFYARHNCDEYTYFPSYRYDPKGPAQLPLRPPAGA